MEERTVTLRSHPPHMFGHLPGVPSNPPGVYSCPQGILHSCPPGLMELIPGHTLFFLWGPVTVMVIPRLPLPEVRRKLGWSPSPRLCPVNSSVKQAQDPTQGSYRPETFEKGVGGRG